MEKILNITSGKGPAECERVVYNILQEIIGDAIHKGIEVDVLNEVPGKEKNTLYSALIKLKGKELDSFIASWQGSIQWVGESPFRKNHKRKNWFVGVVSYDVKQFTTFNEKDFEYATMRGSGPGGQNVNKVESTVRVTYKPTGLSVTSQDERSQLQNKQIAKQRLIAKLLNIEVQNLAKDASSQWMDHQLLERGNAIRTFKKKL